MHPELAKDPEFQKRLAAIVANFEKRYLDENEEQYLEKKYGKRYPLIAVLAAGFFSFWFAGVLLTLILEQLWRNNVQIPWNVFAATVFAAPPALFFLTGWLVSKIRNDN
jgi:hypothetical protein